MLDMTSPVTENTINVADLGSWSATANYRTVVPRWPMGWDKSSC